MSKDTSKMASNAWLKEIVAWVVKTFGKDVAIAAKEELANVWARLFKSRNILILGPRQSGKSSLIVYVQHGRPYTVNKAGEIVTPDPTLLAAIVDKKFNLQKKNWLKIKTDVPGDPQLRESWKQAVDDIRPHGIIYMVDGRQSDAGITTSMDELVSCIFGACYPTGPRELSTLHVFVNFADHWANTPQTTRAKLRHVRDRIESELDSRPIFGALRYDVAATHLSPQTTTWDLIDRALHKFGADMMAQ